MMYIEKKYAVPVMDKKNQPVIHCASGEVLTFQTKDCFGENIRSDSDLVHTVPETEHNLATGPVYVENALQGDILKVEIQKIVLDDYGCQALVPGDGPLGHLVKQEYTKVFQVKDGQILFNDQITIPVSPMIGVIGTAPAASEKMHTFLGMAADLDSYERITLLSLIGNMEICQVVNPLKTARMAVPSYILDGYGYKLP